MINDAFRPWGAVSWLMPRLKKDDWQIVGCVAAEERSLAILDYRSNVFSFGRADFFCIEDQPSEFAAECSALRAANLVKFKSIAGIRGLTYDAKLLQSVKTLQTLMSKILNNDTENLILDISSLPKRFFFPLTRWILANNKVKNFVVMYTLPEQYTPEQLAYEPDNWAQLPTFQTLNVETNAKTDCVVVGVGFVPFGLPGLLRHDYSGAKVMLILPFPPGPPQAQRTWQFVYEIERECKLADDRQIVRVNAYDVAGCFDEINAITECGAKKTILAPYGPKPHSLAMCLYAIARDADVFYTQPRFYHPRYSSGIKRNADGPEGYAYALKLDGRNLYATDPAEI